MGEKIRFCLETHAVSRCNPEWMHFMATVRDVLSRGGLAILPTETSYMLAADASNEQAIRRLRSVKQRPDDQALSVAFATVELARKWTHWDSRAMLLANRFLPGPLTLILPIRDDVAPLYVSKGGWIGVRIPLLEPLLDILSLIDFPVTATSANPHGMPEPFTIGQCVSDGDVIWDAGVLPPNRPSTIVSLAGHPPECIRTGAISERCILEALELQ